jgi:ATP-dependent Zn protease
MQRCEGERLMNAEGPTGLEREHTAVHEAGHAVLESVMGLGLRSVTIVPDFDDMSAGHALHSGESPEQGSDAEALLMYAEEAFWLRHAVALYAGAEAVRQIRPQDGADGGGESDRTSAAVALNKITDDTESLDLYFALAKRRCTLLVEFYRSEIEALAAALLARHTLSGTDVRKIVTASMRERHIFPRTW